jgi:DNA-binding GntR family transcriptional regulator
MPNVDRLDGLVLRRVSTAQQVADGLTEMILRGKMTPGEQLKESALASSLGISRNTMREAVRILEQGGLVRRYDMHRGASVIEPSDEELAEVYEARLRLEALGVASSKTPEAVAEIRLAFDALAQSSEMRQLHLMVEKDLAFHAAIVHQIGSRRIDEFYAQLARELRFYLAVLSVEDREFEEPEDIMSEHSGIMEALEAGDSANAQTLIEELIRASETRVRTIFRERASRE